MSKTQEIENVPQYEEQTSPQMGITKEQAKYWYAVVNHYSR